MAVSVDLAGLKRQRSRFGDGVLVLLADCPDPAAVAVLAEVADFGFASGEFKGLSPMKAGVAPSPEGPVFVLEPAPPQLWAWLAELAHRLEERGLSGRLVPATPAEYEPWMDLGRPGETFIGSAGFWPGWGYGEPPRWSWDDVPGREVPVLAGQWCAQAGGRSFLYVGVLTEVAPADLPGVVAMAAEHDGLTQAWAGGPEPGIVRSVNFSSRGFAGCLMKDDSVGLAGQVAPVLELFGWYPGLMSYAFVRRFRSSADPQFVSEQDFGPFPFRPSKWASPRNTWMIDRLVLDAHAVQLLTGAHLERATSLDGWQVSEVAPDRFVVRAPDLTPWLAGPVPNPEVLAQARRDFGRMIATPELVAELRDQT